MELGLYTDSVAELGFEAALDLAVEIGATGIEIATGGQSSAPHLRVAKLISDKRSRARFSAALESRRLRLSALNCSAWPMHPILGPTHVDLIKDTIRLAGELGVEKIVTMSGTPGDGVGATTINWLWYPWPPDAVRLRERQWDQAVTVWQELAAFAVDHGVERIALELHPLHLVYNVPTLLRMRQAVGPVIGANVDPSHLFWQQMDPQAVVRCLGEAVYHVHLKDTEIVAQEVALAGLLDQRPFETGSARAWVFRTIGRAHNAEFWGNLVDSLREARYDDVLAIENEDVSQTPVEGVREAAALMRGVLTDRNGAQMRSIAN